jgi:hypothetical protein
MAYPFAHGKEERCMTERRIEPFEFRGKTIYIEVTEAQLDREPALLAGSGQELPDYLEPTAVKDKVIAAGDIVRDTIAALAETVHQGLATLEPDEWKLEVNLGFKGKTGLPFVAEGEANGAVKVSATWKRKPEA